MLTPHTLLLNSEYFLLLSRLVYRKYLSTLCSTVYPYLWDVLDSFLEKIIALPGVTIMIHWSTNRGFFFCFLNLIRGTNKFVTLELWINSNFPFVFCFFFVCVFFSVGERDLSFKDKTASSGKYLVWQNTSFIFHYHFWDASELRPIKLRSFQFFRYN